MGNLVVQTNVLALNSHRNLGVIGAKQSQASGRLSSGYRINSAADDAAGLAISEKMRSQIRGLDQASKNAQDASSLIQTAEGGMNEIDNMVQRMRELVVQVSNDTNDQKTTDDVQGDRQKIQDELNQLMDEIDSMSDRVEFNKKTLINGTYSSEGAFSTELKTQLKDTVVSASAAFKPVQANYNSASNAVNKTSTTANVESNAYNTASNAANVASNTANAVSTAENAASTVYNATSTVEISASLAANIASAAYAADSSAPNLTAYKNAESTYVKASNATNTTSNAYLAASNATNNTSNAYLVSSTMANAASAVYNAASVVYNADSTAFLSTETAYESASTAYNDTIDTVKATPKDNKGSSLYFQIGANASQGLEMEIGSVTTDSLGIGLGFGRVGSELNVMQITGKDTTDLLDKLDSALTVVTTERSKLGAAQNRLSYTRSSLDISSENLAAAQSRIRDTDMAKEMMALTAANVLQQAGVSMLSQANQAPQSILSLLR